MKMSHFTDFWATLYNYCTCMWNKSVESWTPGSRGLGNSFKARLLYLNNNNNNRADYINLRFKRKVSSKFCIGNTAVTCYKLQFAERLKEIQFSEPRKKDYTHAVKIKNSRG